MDDALDTAPCGCLTFVDDGTITRANSTLAAMLGYERETLHGMNLAKILSIGARIFYQTHFFPLLKLHGVVEELYLTLRPLDGADVPVLVNATRREHQGEAWLHPTTRQRDAPSGATSGTPAARGARSAEAIVLVRVASLLSCQQAGKPEG